MNSLPKTVTRQRRGCDLNPGPSVPESSTLTTRLPSHPRCDYWAHVINRERKCADTIGTALVRWAGHFQRQNINIYFSNKIHGSNFAEQHSETVMV